MSAVACGTRAGYARHRRLREPACRPCMEANADYCNRRSLALSELKRRHPVEYQMILEEMS